MTTMNDGLEVQDYSTWGEGRTGWVIAQLEEGQASLPAWYERGYPANLLWPTGRHAFETREAAETALRLYRADIELCGVVY
jgi:hypothetical protein